MEREDMLERAVRQVAAALARILGRSATATPIECLDDLDSLCRQYMGLPADLLDRLPPHEIQSLIDAEIRKGRISRADAAAIVRAVASERSRAGESARAAALNALADSLAGG